MGDRFIIEDSLLYYCREKRYRMMQITAAEASKRDPEDAVYELYYSISLIHEDRFSEAKEIVNNLENGDLTSMTCRFLIPFLKAPQENLDILIKTHAANDVQDASGRAFYVTGVSLMLLNKPKKAKFFLSHAVNAPELLKRVSVLMGWIELLTNNYGPPTKEAWKHFEQADNSSSEAVFGRAKYYEKQKNYTNALEVLNQGIVLFPKFVPNFIEKMKVHLMLEEWDQTTVTAHRALSLDEKCIEAATFILIHLLTHGGDNNEIEGKLKSLYNAIMTWEPKNPLLLCETAQVLARLSGSFTPILEASLSMAKKAADLRPTDPEINAEYGYLCLHSGKISEASKVFKNHACARSVPGYILCLISGGEYEEANEQLKSYKQLEASNTLEVFSILATLEEELSGSSNSVIEYINEALTLYLQSLEGIPWSMNFYRMLQPSFIYDLCEQLMRNIPSKVSKSKCLATDCLEKCREAAQLLHRACPDFIGFSTSVLLARLKFLEGDLAGAKSLLYQWIDKPLALTDGRITMAKIHLCEGNLYAASHCLEVALSHNFEVRENFDYLLIKAEIQKQQELLKDAIETLMFAKSIALSEKPKMSQLQDRKISLAKRMNLYEELIQVFCDLHKFAEAKEAMKEADFLFRDTPEQDRLRFVCSYFALASNDIDAALKLLEEITPDKPCFLEAVQKRAEIYLKYKKNRIKFVNCYREAAKEKRSPETLNLLGDSYMKIEEPERALEAYEQALKLYPKDSDLARKIGTTLVKTHNYEKAVTYYKAAIKAGGSESLRYDLCSLLCVIKRYKEAQEMINAALESNQNVDNLLWLVMESKYQSLLSEVYSNLELEDHAMNALKKAWSVQTRVLRKVHMEQGDVEEHRKKAKEICSQLAAHASRKKDFGSAVQYYREALTFDENDTEILLALAKLHVETHDLDAARQYCAIVLSKDSENIPAAIMLADMLFEAGDLQSAKFQFQKLLDIKPDFFEAIARYIEVVRRLGKLEHAEVCLQKAEDISTNLVIDPGYYYCKGLYEWYTGNTSDALKCFNKTRSAPLWGQISLCHMIEICINPENENFATENVDVDADLILKEKAANSQEGNIRTAEKLLLELKSKYGASLNTRILNNLILLAKHSKTDAEAALNDFIEILTDDRYKDHAGAILGSAMAYLVLKQTPRARNQLKRIAKTVWNFNDAEYLEKAWLLLADIYIKAGKLQSASEMLDKVLSYNKSCTKAYDFYGYIAEKDQNYLDAVKNYEKAWLLTSKSNPVIGYKLAYNNMKAKRYAESIEVCQLVLAKYPNYPKIKKEILDRSRTCLRS
ncbi:tetratricopeptide repeat protein 21B-like [Uloborus diversus]|uniref:tetratricopeptide repeat protein 21B-like n=1 Tax=Uloborus diversus TaxID=327109 RepID=UPI00240A5C60|nr:tetratricopeptide repeat protein 21B-like [Uloborus diversus]